MKVLVLYDYPPSPLMNDAALRDQMGKAGRETWSAALYLYAAKCVELKSTPFFEETRWNLTETERYKI
jgi:hypothetical protein